MKFNTGRDIVEEKFDEEGKERGQIVIQPAWGFEVKDLGRDGNMPVKDMEDHRRRTVLREKERGLISNILSLKSQRVI